MSFSRSFDRLSEEVGQSASVSVLDGTEVVYVARAAQRRVMSINLSPGSRLPPYCASMGRVLLAQLPEEDARTLLNQSTLRSFTPKTKTDIDELVEELRTIRAQALL